MRLGFRPREPSPVAPPVLGPADLAGAERAQQWKDGTELFQPDIHAALADAARPEPHDEDARAVRRPGRVIDAFDRDHVPILSSDFLNLSHGSTSSIFGVNHTKSNGSASLANLGA